MKSTIETLYGIYNQFRVIKKEVQEDTPPQFYIQKDGRTHATSFNSLQDAIDATEKESSFKP